MKRLNKWLEDEPVIAMLIGWALIILIGLALLPADPPSIAQALHERAT